MLGNIKIVLIQTYHPGNIGAVARAMKNMALSNLVLVNPVQFPHPEADSRAGQALDLLKSATVVDSLELAIKDSTLVIATSARQRGTPLPLLDIRSAASELVQESQHDSVAVVFGRERMGLSNADIQKCHKQLVIPANPEYPDVVKKN